MTVAFHLDGQEFVALNGGPQLKFTEAVSFVPIARRRKRWMSIRKNSPMEGKQYNAAGQRQIRFIVAIVPTALREMLTDPMQEAQNEQGRRCCK
jgi:predicted 3-demethylubiquinone-9 3-methyltransferase (glyoxalase superfamily)